MSFSFHVSARSSIVAKVADSLEMSEALLAMPSDHPLRDRFAETHKRIGVRFGNALLREGMDNENAAERINIILELAHRLCDDRRALRKAKALERKARVLAAQEAAELRHALPA